MDPTGLWDRPKEPLFQVLDRTRARLKGTRINRHDVLQIGQETRQESRTAPDRELQPAYLGEAPKGLKGT